MKSLALDETGDLLLENGAFQMVDGKELIRQKVFEVINTHKGEWPFDWEQGVDQSHFLGKGVTEEAVMAEIADGLKQVDENLSIADFAMTKKGRSISVRFAAVSETTNEEISVTTDY